MGAPTTVIFSDVHLTTAEPVDPQRPLWKRYKQRDLFVDDDLAAMIVQARDEADGTLEVVLNGDVFDFDAATDLPDPPDLPTNWIERGRGLNPTELKSTFKMGRILDDHPAVVEALRDVIRGGGRVVFVVGNHDLELLWPAVQTELRNRLEVEGGERVRVCSWFYVSNRDTLIEHGHQYDPYCVCLDPISPTIRVPPHGEARVRLPFGNYASRYMVNGMGLINPHADKAFIMPFWGYVVFFYRHVARTQPLLLFTWMWTAVATFLASVRDGLLPAETDVLSLEDRVDAVAREAQSSPRVVRALAALKVHPAIFMPWKVARELWLDRLALALAVMGVSWWFVSTMHAVFALSLWWFFGVMALLMVPFLFYAHGVSSDAEDMEQELRQRVGLVSRITGVTRVVLGHTHRERHTRVDGVEILNPGTWSPAYEDVACTKPVGRRCAVRLIPTGRTRRAQLDQWTEGRFVTLPFEPAEPLPLLQAPVPTIDQAPEGAREDARV